MINNISLHLIIKMQLISCGCVDAKMVSELGSWALVHRFCFRTILILLSSWFVEFLLLLSSSSFLFDCALIAVSSAMTTNQDYSKFVDFATNNGNPFYLHPSETPATILVTPVLEGTKNFQPWIHSMRTSLVSKNKLSFVDGTFKVPEKSDSIFNQWMRCNSMVLSWIQCSVSTTVQKSITYFDKAYEAWMDLHDRFSQCDMFRIADLQEDIFRLSQGNLGVSEYYTELKGLWDELENFCPLSSCKCSTKCSCGALESVCTFRDQDYTIRFLKGLSE